MADHQRILAAAALWRGQPMALATVISTWRSAPCPVGTHMLVQGSGDFVGSVSGGCVEGDVLAVARDVIAGAPHRLCRYGVDDAAAWEVGLPCGGEIVVLIQSVRDGGFSPMLFDRIVAGQRGGARVMIGTHVETGVSRVVDAPADAMFVNVYAPPKRLLIVGAVEIAASLSVIARQLGTSVTLIDPRARFLTAARFPGVALDDRWPDEAIGALAPDSRSAIVMLSHDPKIDDPALIAALASPAGYIGALGSRASQAARCARLSAQGIGAASLARIEGPAGIAINAVNAPEIALSIAAAIVRSFNDGLR